MTGTHSQFEHDRYEELCALSTAGALTPEESDELSAHLHECAACRNVFAQYQSLATEGMPHLAGWYASPADPEAQEDVPGLERLMATVDRLEEQYKPTGRAMLGLIAACLLVAVAFGAYKTGERKRIVAAPAVAIAGTRQEALAHQANYKKLETTLEAERNREAELETLAASQAADVAKLQASAKDAEDRLNSLTDSLASSRSNAAAQVVALTQERDATAARLRDAQQSYQTAQQLYQSAQDELNTLRSQHKQDLLHLASLDDRINGLNAALDDSDSRRKNDEQYLASDKDIRDLIGARNLYIADIMDVDESGASQKPFGRVFYTKTKSLVFYAYDLDRQPGVKQASTFQVWGRTGHNDRKPVNLGVLFMDSETNHRWALRVNDPQQLAQLDAIFVTVEPHGQKDKPTGKPFLYASLRRDANHP